MIIPMHLYDFPAILFYHFNFIGKPAIRHHNIFIKGQLIFHYFCPNVFMKMVSKNFSAQVLQHISRGQTGNIQQFCPFGVNLFPPLAVFDFKSLQPFTGPSKNNCHNVFYCRRKTEFHKPMFFHQIVGNGVLAR